MTLHKNIITFCLLLITIQGFSQKSMVIGKDTINRLDAKNLKQGKWVFFNESQHPQVMCSFKNDELVGKRIYMIDSGKVLVREPRNAGKEKFLFINKDEKIKGWFDDKGRVCFENQQDSLKKDSVITYLFGVPALYAFGQKNLADEIDAVLKPLKNQMKANKLVIEFLINRSGITEKIILKFDKPNKKLEQKINTILSDFDRWQPAFNGWKTEPYKKQIIVNY